MVKGDVGHLVEGLATTEDDLPVNGAKYCSLDAGISRGQ